METLQSPVRGLFTSLKAEKELQRVFALIPLSQNFKNQLSTEHKQASKPGLRPVSNMSAPAAWGLLHISR